MIVKKISITFVIILQTLFSSTSLAYSPSSNLLQKIDIAVEKIEILISSSWELLRDTVIKKLEWFKTNNMDDDRSIYILNYIINEISNDDVVEIEQKNESELSFNYAYVTPSQTEWPYYPVSKPIDRDNDLLQVWDWEQAWWDVLLFSWRVGYVDGTLLDAWVVEIWQTDADSNYMHPNDSWYKNRDKNFQFYGESLIDQYWWYSFTTIVPGEYGTRPSHIHAIVRDKIWDVLLTTQIYFSWVSSHKNQLDSIATSSQDAQSMLIMELKKQEDTYVWAHDIVVPNN